MGSQRQKLGPVRNKVKFTEDGFNFGGKTFVGSGPTNSGEVIWTWGGGQVSPSLTGTLHINNAATACARICIEYFREDDTALADRFGGKVCAPDNQHHHWDVDLEPYSDGKLAYIRISPHTLGADDTWRTGGSTASHYLKVPIALYGGGRRPGGCLHTASFRID